MTLRSAAVVPPTRLLVVPLPMRWTPTTLPSPAVVAPVAFVPRKFPAMMLLDELRLRMAAPGDRLMQSPRIVLPAERALVPGRPAVSVYGRVRRIARVVYG